MVGVGNGNWGWLTVVGVGNGDWGWVIVVGVGKGDWGWVTVVGLGDGDWGWVTVVGVGNYSTRNTNKHNKILTNCAAYRQTPINTNKYNQIPECQRSPEIVHPHVVLCKRLANIFLDQIC